MTGAECGVVEHPPVGMRLFVCTLPEGHDGDHLDAKGMNHTWPRAEQVDYLLMNDDATVTPLTRCDDCGFLFRDIEKHVAESVTVLAYDDKGDSYGY